MNNCTIIWITITSALLTLIIYFLKNPEKVDKWNHILIKLFEWRKSKREKKLISSSIDYRITKIAKKINKESDGIIPYGIRLKWEKAEEVSSYVKQGNVVVVLKKQDNIDQNIVEACMAYVPQSLLPKSRNTIDNEVLESIDHYIVRKILSVGNYTSAYNFFVRSVLDDKLTSNTDFFRWFEDISKIDAIGFFTRVLLEEYRLLGEQLYGTLEENQYIDETKKFLQFLRGFYLRKPGDDTTKLSFLGNKIRIGIVLIAKKRTWDISGINAYIKRIYKYRKIGVNRIFLFSYAHENENVTANNEGFVLKLTRKKEFRQINEVEKLCYKFEFLKLLKRQNYRAFDVAGTERLARYCLFEVLE